MDFSAWSPSHTILVVVMVFVTAVGFIGQVAVLFHRTRQLEKRQDKQGEDLHRQGETFIHALERLENRIDKRFEEVNHRFTEVNQRFTEVNQRLTDMQTEIRDVRNEMRQLNQNHIDHLAHHES